MNYSAPKGSFDPKISMHLRLIVILNNSNNPSWRPNRTIQTQVMIKSKMVKFQTFEKIIKNPSEVLENHLHHIMIEMDLLNQFPEFQSSNFFRLGSRACWNQAPGA